MQRSTLNSISLLLRRSHMYLALFLTPWMTMYALSTLVFNHFSQIARLYGGNMDRFEKEKELPYTRAFPSGAENRAIGEQILKDLNLTGSFNAHKPDDNEGERLVIDRHDPLAHRRITYYPAEKRLVIEKEAFRTPGFLTSLHASLGYGRFKVRKLWAFGVDLCIFGTLLWILSGFWLWWQLKITRRWGAWFALAGFTLFGMFLVLA